MRKSIFLLCLLFPFLLQAKDEARLLRFPSTNGKVVVFTYAGNLYSVSIDGGVARKLTSDIGFEMFSHFSPDGKTIAFTGQYDGNTEVYTMSAEGGSPTRITYTPTFSRDDVSDRMGPNNIVAGWMPDGKSIVYISKQQAVGFRRLLFSVPSEGGLSQQIPLPEGGFNSYSPDGKKVAYNRVFREFRTWKYYEGGMADDVWIHDFTNHSTINITNNKAQDIFPMWIDNEIFFISDRDRTMNLFSYNLNTKETNKLTDFKEFDIKFPTCFGQYIVFENGGYIFKFDAKTRRTDKVEIKLADDNIYSRNEIKNVSQSFSNLSLSPNGERVAITARGDIYNVPVNEGVTRNLTATSGAHERNANWSPDGKLIAYVSDKTGETEIYVQAPNANNSEAIQLTSGSDSYIYNLDWSPDSKKISYIDRKGRLFYIDVATKQRTQVVANDWGFQGMSFDWSPDSKWLSYSLRQANDINVIYLYNVAEAKSYPVTDKWYSSRSPVFSRDGKYLFFVSSRDFNPIYARNEWNVIYTEMDKIYFAVLAKDTPSPFADKDDEVAIATDAKDSKNTSDNKSSETKIDINNISQRIESLPIAVGNYYSVFSVNDKVYYSAGRTTKMFDLKTKKETELGEGIRLSLSPNGKKVLAMRGRNVSVIDVPNGKINLDKTVNLGDMKVTVNYQQEWKQIFDESWRHMRDGFYVRNMHGVDWKAMREKYEVLLPYVNHRADLTYIIGEMIGELNVGHAYVNSGEMPKPERIKMGMLGAKLSLDKSGYFRIDKIMEGANWSKSLRSPLSEIGVNANEGDYITAVDGISTKGVKDIYSLLVGKADTKVELTLNAKAEAGGRKIIVTPIADENALYYYNWVQTNIRKVEKATNGRVGYVHIPDMGADGMNEFTKYFYPQLDKEALIIDDRSNGGGNVSPIILERLARVPYRATMWNTSSKTGTVPDKTLVGPKVVLIDKYSMSDGDLFPYGFRKLGLGKLIGTRTWGGIVGISGSLPFVDGADMRVPFFTSYSVDTGEWIIEGYGVDPDITIDNDPYKEWMGEDEQLNRAIEEMLKELKNRKPIPPVPAGQDKSK